LVDNDCVMPVSQTQEFGTLSGLSNLLPMPRIGTVPDFDIASCSIPGADRLLAEAGAPGQRSFRGRIVMPGVNVLFPEQEFIETSTADQIVLSSQPEGKWPIIVIEIRRDRPGTPFRCTAMRALKADNSAEAWLLLTRFMFSATLCEKWSIVDEHGIVLELAPRIDSTLTLELRHLASVVRKLSYIGAIFNIDFSIPEALMQDDLFTAEIVFRAITEGNFAVRSNEITFRRLNLTKLDLRTPPFERAGPFPVRREAVEQTKWSLLGHNLDLGPYTISVKRAEIANHSVLRDMQKDNKHFTDLKFIVYDNQVRYSFDCYAGKKDRKTSSLRLNSFKKELAKEEPKELAALIDESLQSEVSPFEASQIAMGWLQYNDFPDRYCAQKPILDESSGQWRVPIHLAYPDGKGGRVGELTVDLKTGVVTSETSVETVRANGAALAQTLLDAR
jgi:hypothetical protein